MKYKNLDKTQVEPPQNTTYSNVAFGFSILAISIFAYYTYLNIEMPFYAKLGSNKLAFLFNSFEIAAVLGFIFSILSYVSKEKQRILKHIALILNSICILVLLSILVA